MYKLKDKIINKNKLYFSNLSNKKKPLSSDPQTLWKNLNWQLINIKVYKMQIEIFKMTKKRNFIEVHKLQTRLIKMTEAKYLAVRRVTQDNRGKNTAGVDGICKLEPSERYKLANKLKLNSRSRRIKHITIPKSGSKDKRPLGIPTMHDRALQALVKLALEPQWEALFESNSYGFRPGRKAVDATWRIRNKMREGSFWVFDGDIKKCFDNINHDVLLEKLNTTLDIKNQVESWLNAGLFEKGPIFFNPGKGIPQGAVISSLLANIVLDGCQKEIWDAIYNFSGNKKKADRTLFVRYANDFVIISPQKEHLIVAIEAFKTHIKKAGLVINSNKSRILHTLNKDNCEDGNTKFDFLGFTFSQRKVSKYKLVKLGHNKKPAGVRTAVLPAKNKIKNHFKEVSYAIQKSSKAIDLIRTVNPILRGWRNYYKYSDARTYGKLPGAWDSRLNLKLRHWVKRRFNKQGRPDICWTSVGGDNWVFYAYDSRTKKKVYLDKYANCSWSLQSYNRIDSKRSPFDGDQQYWCNHSGFRLMGPNSPKREYLLRKQKGLCLYCKNPFSPDDLLFAEIDHIKPRFKGGLDKWGNLNLLHKSCHAEKTSVDLLDE